MSEKPTFALGARVSYIAGEMLVAGFDGETERWFCDVGRFYVIDAKRRQDGEPLVRVMPADKRVSPERKGHVISGTVNTSLQWFAARRFRADPEPVVGYL